MKKILILALACSCVVAQAQVVTTDAVGPKTTTGLTGFTTEGDDMVGMTVRVTYGDNTTSSAVWAATGADAGAATGSDWSLSLDGDSFGAAWEFDVTGSKRVSKIFLNGAPGMTVFDILADDGYTAGSALGAPFEILSGISTPDNVTANYSNPLSLNADAHLGDLYVTLAIDLGDQAIAPGSGFTFRADTDNAVTEIVPEPATMSVLALGALAAWRRKKKA